MAAEVDALAGVALEQPVAEFVETLGDLHPAVGVVDDHRHHLARLQAVADVEVQLAGAVVAEVAEVEAEVEAVDHLGLGGRVLGAGDLLQQGDRPRIAGRRLLHGGRGGRGLGGGLLREAEEEERKDVEHDAVL